MLNALVITLNTGEWKREILLSPFLLQSKKLPDLRSGKISALFLYENWVDDNYKSALNAKHISDRFKTNSYLINYGQDFSKYYLGSVAIDFDNKTVDRAGDLLRLDEDEFKQFTKAFFNPGNECRNIVVFTPTDPSAFNFGII